MKRRSFFAAICAILGFRSTHEPLELGEIYPSRGLLPLCREPTCDKYGTHHLDWHSQFMHDPKAYTATDVLRDRQRYLTDTHNWYLKVEPPPETRWLYLSR